MVDLAELRLAPGQRLIGLDLGEKTIGVALSDIARMVATPMETLKRGKFGNDAAILEAHIEAGRGRFRGILGDGERSCTQRQRSRQQ